MTKKEALYQFRNVHFGVVKGDSIYTRENWNNFVDMLNKEGYVSNYQANNWTNPF